MGNYIAKWNGASWSTLGGNYFESGMSDPVRALAVYNGDLFAGGSFRYAFGNDFPATVSANFIAKWDGSTWSPLESAGQNGVSAEVWALTVHKADLVVGGRFFRAGGEISLLWARWGPVGPFVSADLNLDCHVDADDLELVQGCITGPASTYRPNGLPSGCQLIPDTAGYLAADLDRDADIDQDDFGLFQRCYSGPAAIADPDCAD